MEKEFLDYPEALELKELGFDEPCFTYFLNGIIQPSLNPKDYTYFSEMSEINKNMLNYENVLRPTYSQAFRFFREKYDLHPYIITLRGEWIVIGIIRCSDAEKITGSFDTNFNTLEEAELECLKKLIQIVKEK